MRSRAAARMQFVQLVPILKPPQPWHVAVTGQSLAAGSLKSDD